MCNNTTKITESQFFDQIASSIEKTIVKTTEIGKDSQFCRRCIIELTVNALGECIKSLANIREGMTGRDANEYLEMVCENIMDNTPPTPEQKTDLKIVH